MVIGFTGRNTGFFGPSTLSENQNARSLSSQPSLAGGFTLRNGPNAANG